MLIVTHDLQEAADLCDEVALLDAGRVLAQGEVPALVASLCGTEAEVVVVTAPGARGHDALSAEGFVAAAEGEWSRHRRRVGRRDGGPRAPARRARRAGGRDCACAGPRWRARWRRPCATRRRRARRTTRETRP